VACCSGGHSACFFNTKGEQAKKHTAEPGKGYDTKAAEWRAKLKQAETGASPD